MAEIKKDPAYDWIEPAPHRPIGQVMKKGIQCGLCGRKFDYGMYLGKDCKDIGCPMWLRDKVANPAL